MSRAAVVAGVLAGSAALAWIGPHASLPGRGGNDRRGRTRLPRSPGRPVLLLGGLVASLALVLVGTPQVVVVFVLIAAGAFVVAQRKRAQQVTFEQRLADAVADIVGSLGADVAAGAVPLDSLAEAAAECASSTVDAARTALGRLLSTVVATGRLGGDVCGELRRAAKSPGAEGLRDLAIAWEVAERSGARLAVVLDGVIEGLAEKRAARNAVDAALAGARASARLLAVLPVFGLGLGSALGADPFLFLVGHSVGRLCLFAGLGLEAAGVWWTERLAASARRTAA